MKTLQKLVNELIFGQQDDAASRLFRDLKIKTRFFINFILRNPLDPFLF